MCHKWLRFLIPRFVRQLLGGRVAAVAVSLSSSPPSRLYSSTSDNPSHKASLVAPPQEPRQFYRRPLPASCIAFGTAEGRQLFKEALEMGFLECFFDLVPQLRTQVQPSYCGLSAMVMVLNSFEMDPGRVWKAPWRWYHEDMLTCCLSSEDLLTHGITLDQFQSIAKCNGLNVDLRQPTSPGETVETFRSSLLNICSQSLSTSGTILVVSYDRKAVKQTGNGHYALVSGYHPKRDLILVLETAAFKYPSHWAPLTAIYNGMCSLDNVTGRPRGYMFITKAFHARTGLLSPYPHGPAAPDADARDPSAQQPLSANDPPSALAKVAPYVSQLINQLTLFCLPDTVYQAFSSSASLLDLESAGGRLRAVADEWSAYLSSTSLESLGKTCCCLLQSHNQERGQSLSRGQREPYSALGPGNCSPILTSTSPPQIGPAHRCDCPCLVDILLDRLLALLVKHRPPNFFFSCQPLWAESSPSASSTNETATQVVFELVSSAAGRRARLALERLQHRSYEWLTSDSGGPLTYRAAPTSGLGLRGTVAAAGSSVPYRRPACALPLVTDPKIRATSLLTAFLLAFPYHTVPHRSSTTGDATTADDGGSEQALVGVLKSSHHLLYHLPLLPGQTCFAVLTPGTRNELTTLSNILAQLVTTRRSPGSRCIENAVD
ncbi:Glutathione gamma-glutamylcysteinyltransferase 3 [Echinococcus granulosus]|uniref:glutathione gamma-glutamylcysteinyltransferase n=1 Tax=Echinococcus granulosus TaxID=6210 RepID=A0A068WRQ4_ECHGR|nr:Glutathione gamma-glutamylcysteinyltransferase 3 [Echinococcus granulosus]CDS20336.1 phytochelatin synthase [Echinococcus granulosus]